MSITVAQQDIEQSGVDTILGMIVSFFILGIMMVCYIQGPSVGLTNVGLIIGGSGLICYMYMITAMQKKLALIESRIYVACHNVATFLIWFYYPNTEVDNIIAVALGVNVVIAFAVWGIRLVSNYAYRTR